MFSAMTRKKIWFAWTSAMVALYGLVILLIVALASMGFIAACRQSNIALTIALLILAPLLAVLAVLKAWRFYRQIQAGMSSELKRRGCCAHCEFDLRASEGRCPECGAKIPAGSGLPTQIEI